MASIATEIKNIIASHLRRTLFGMEIYGRHEDTIFDGKEDRVLILEVTGASRFERYGCVVVYHPTFGKWQATLLSEHHSGKPVQVLTTEEIQEALRTATAPSPDYIYKVYGGEKPNTPPVLWDPYWDAK
jgi:hypothetical protein